MFQSWAECQVIMLLTGAVLISVARLFNRTNKNVDRVHCSTRLPQKANMDCRQSPSKGDARRHRACVPLRQQLPGRGPHRAARRHDPVGGARHRRIVADATRAAE